ncbi:SIMPL domain-containing protein [Chloroflexota bacterium]
MKKKWLLFIGLLSIVGVLGLASCTTSPATVGDVNNLNLSSQQQGIWVNAEGKVAAVPNIATLRLGIDAQAESVAAAQSQASDAMDKVMAALKNEGVAGKDIQTQYFSIQRMTRWDNDKQIEVVTGYRVTNQVTAKIRKIESVGEIIDTVADAGGDLTRIDNISFSVEDPTQYYGEARIAAMKAAKEKATQLASLAGVTLGIPTFVTESSFSSPPIYLERMESIPMAGAAKVETPISPGETEITLNVQVTYAIK